MSGNYSQKVLYHAKKSGTDALKTSKRVFEITAEGTGDLIGNKIANRITKVSKNLETVINEHDKEIPKERYIYISRRKTINY